MGNSNSHPTQVLSPHHAHWAHSYPRPKQFRIPDPHLKVLPERVPPLKLRSTDNGNILHNGGTISGRKQGGELEEIRVYRPRSSSAHRPPKIEQLDKSRFGSEPDLRIRPTGKEMRDDSATKQRISRSRKKYKAPPAPAHLNGSGMDSSSPDLNRWESHPGDYATPGRRARLFKTRAETNKRSSTNKRSESEEPEVQEVRSKSSEKASEDNRTQHVKLRRSASHEVISSTKRLSTPEFQAELVEVAQRIRPKSALLRESPKEKDSSPTSQLRSRNSLREISKENIHKKNEENYARFQNNEKLRQELEIKLLKQKNVPAKTFYFGMNDDEVENSTNNKMTEHRLLEKSKNRLNLQDEQDAAVEKFAASFHKVPVTVPSTNTNSCSSSFVSDPDDDVDGGIALQLRPTLPKKQLEIPRFSPTAAWRQLSSIESLHPMAPSPGGSDDVPLVLEERIRPPLSSTVHHPVHDKSGDSGISGDASPGGCHESSSEVAITSSKNQRNKSYLVAWTPQQDLEEESSSDGLESPDNSPKSDSANIPGAKFNPRFSIREQSFLSLPRDEHLSVYVDNNDIKNKNVAVDNRFNSLKRLKGALGIALVNGKSNRPEDGCLTQDSNWVLSRSVPSSLNNSHLVAGRTSSNPSSPEHEEEGRGSPYYSRHQSPLGKQSPFPYLATGGRMMYLPEYQCRLSPETMKDSSANQNGVWSKSCENISTEVVRPVKSPMTHYSNDEDMNYQDHSMPRRKGKKFTFQSTVRLIENRKLAERLSREAELKENQRLSELEAMRRVEEEFQKKRAREKANIRHQLRLFSLEESNYTSLPPLDWGDSRAEPDGAPSSSPTFQSKKPVTRKNSAVGENGKVASSTQVLSEFRETRRDYRDYRHPRYHEPNEDVTKRSVVQHPRAVYDMPKNTPVYVSAHNSVNHVESERRSGGMSTPRSSSSDNYRRDFAHGAIPTCARSLASSDSELSQPNTRPLSREHRVHLLHRSRSASPLSQRSRSVSPQRSSTPPRSSSASPTRNYNDSTDLSRTPSPHNKITINGCDIDTQMEQRVWTEEIHSLELPSLETDITPTIKESSVQSSTLPRVVLTSLKPFKKEEKSYKPIQFNPQSNNNKSVRTVS